MRIRRVAVFHNITNVNSAWCCAEGLAATLTAQGYEVFDCKNPRLTPSRFRIAKNDGRSSVMGAPEWFYDAILRFYGDEWTKLRATTIAWYAESADREDQNFNFSQYKTLADLNYFPAIQDAEEFNGNWLPFGVHTGVFKPLGLEKRYDVAFIG